jgi:YfiH family protein
MLSSPLLDEFDKVMHGFGTRDDRMDDIFRQQWRRRPVQHERHGTRIAVVDRPNEDCGEADGMLTSQPGLLLSIATADCSPILLARRDGKEVAALHAGWRGALGGIVQRFADLIGERGSRPADWVAAIGPSAGSCCYEVSDELVGLFHERHGMPLAVIAPRPRQLNLSAIVQWQLAHAGFISTTRCVECTICHPGNPSGAGDRFAFHSYRRDRATRTPVVDVQWSVIAICDN